MPSMTTALEQRAASRVAPIGLLFLVTASVGWGLNWPVMKFVFSEWPPLSARGWAGVIGAAALALYAVATGVSLKVPADQWPRLIISAILNVALWVAVMSYALLWLPASEAVVIAYTMPVWTALLAWPLLGERLTLLRVTALVMAFAGLASLFGAGGMSANMAKLPGVLLALTGSVGFAVGTIFLKRYPIQLPGATSATWQIAIGSVPIALAGTLPRASAYCGTIIGRLVRARLYDPRRPLHRLCHLVWRGRAPAGLGRGDRHYAGAGDRCRRLGDCAA